MKYLQLAIREPAEQRNPMHTFLMDHDGVDRAQLWNWSTTTDDADLMLFRVIGAMGPYTAALEAAPFIADFETERIDETAFYAYVEHETRAEDHAFREPFLDQRVLTLPPIEFAADGDTRMEIVGRAVDVQAVLEGFPDTFDVRVDQIGGYGRGMPAFASVLTDRQRDVLATAVELGYYEVPRTATVEDVAAELDCAPSTASDHLRKAQGRIAHRIVEEPDRRSA